MTATLVILTPAMLLLMLVAVQIAIVHHVGNVATAAAHRAALTGSRIGAADGDAAREAARVVDELGSALHRSPTVTRIDDRVIVVVEVRAPTLLPWSPDVVRRIGVAVVEQRAVE